MSSQQLENKFNSAVKSLDKAIKIAMKLGIDSSEIETLKAKEIKRLQQLYGTGTLQLTDRMYR